MDAETPKTKRFRRTQIGVRPEPELVARQMQAAALAFKLFGDAEAARRFMNEPNDRLGGRPIDIAGASSEGLRQVSDALREPRAALPAVGG